MGGPLSADDVAALAALLETQWRRLRAWVELTDAATDPAPSSLPGWSVAELVAHLARAMSALAVCRPAEPGTVPLTLGEYLGTYPDRAEQITAVTRDLAVEIQHDPLRGIDRLSAETFDRLRELRAVGPDPVVQARRAPILLSEMVVSRLVELVVHGDDLVRSRGPWPGPGPLEPGAVQVVSDALLEVLLDRGGWDLEVVDPLAWLRVATGRVPVSVGTVTAALRARSTADSVPDLGSRLPLL
ncbi:maleylpyruvate isomerase N-terminal domain-containing protein [Actinotalea sp. M2MS4P-6]|uniref:maleylpyruvate isomerase N-terminal domain-containing protein n=1 Tax=Actinotalea sp. M2MS4P-6 TaxID=2983762 RepID=UPI0021E4FD11|nr:maleylpyruvate isomerase N-terminal domain-containing protein [Actinotalea sp. M2MS4P-6]MCV2394979.1 maleylpyruvate isomerase N-terminal domain-containing protein [Actinotalea sp. M2MS4P-6]